VAAIEISTTQWIQQRRRMTEKRRERRKGEGRIITCPYAILNMRPMS
jgi:hypothetical protein